MSHCSYANCRLPLYSKDLCRYMKPVSLCWQHHWHLNDLPIDSPAEVMFLYRCGIVAEKKIDQTADAVMKVLQGHVTTVPHGRSRRED